MSQLERPHFLPMVHPEPGVDSGVSIKPFTVMWNEDGVAGPSCRGRIPVRQAEKKYIGQV